MNIYPEYLVKQFNIERNAGFSLNQVSTGSHRKVWWKCDEGHEWEAQIRLRIRGDRCPYCSGKKAWPGYNDFASLHPDLLQQWNYDKNIIDRYLWS